MKDILKIAVLSSVLSLLGCEKKTMTVADQQQDFICKSLIQGFLNTQKLPHYAIDMQMDRIQTKFSYTAQPNQSQARTPRQGTLGFDCILQKREVKLSLVDPISSQVHVILTLNLPSEAQMKRLTAYTQMTN
ncbi:hypothetical protein [Acinetobacter schindleri]|uniref:hypothetical protein n=1 Tax=Acinetobacter schindleri TaxID=108981 RepID=UPI000972DE49|nr:hypothetical protein [Acinetobacter schindleri]APX64163.1 hypothetical protein AsACE_CH02828 [Acinetobacter schindleri]